MEYGLPSVIDHPARYVVIVIYLHRTHGAPEPHFSKISLAEIYILHDRSSDEGCAAGNHEYATVQVVGCCALKVVTLEIQAGDVVHETFPKATRAITPDVLDGTDDSDLRVFHWCQDALEEGGGPEHMII